MMKLTRMIPIEVLRVEDKIIASLTFLQIGILAGPVFLSIFLLFLPPSGKLPLYKLAIAALSFAVCGLLAARVHGKLVLHWLLLIGRYNLRPKAYRQPVKQRSGELRSNIAASRQIELPELIDVAKFVPTGSWRMAPVRTTGFKQRANAENKGRVMGKQ